MPRTIYTERDIEDLARRGVTTIDVDDSVYITDVARERMEALGVQVRRSGAQGGLAAAASSAGPGAAPMSDAEKQQVIEQVKRGVIARLGPGVDAAMVDTLVRRVVGRM